MRQDFRLFCPIAVRWGDMDALGHVNNTRFFTYCESARMRYFEAVDLASFVTGPAEGPTLASATIDFRRQVRYPADLEVGVRASRVGRSSFRLDYQVFRAGSDEIVAEGTSVVVWADYEASASRPLPSGLRAAIRSFDDLPEEAARDDAGSV